MVVAALASTGLDPNLAASLPVIDIRLEDGEAVPIEEEVTVVMGDCRLPVRLKAPSELWTGDRRPPDLSGEPPAEYLPFILFVEMTAAAYCAAADITERDKEFERLYELLRRRPDGTDSNPLFSYLRAGACLYMSIKDVSRAEYEAVMRRLARSARTFHFGCTSTNYFEHAIARLLEL